MVKNSCSSCGEGCGAKNSSALLKKLCIALPEEFRSRIQNVAIVVEDLPPDQSLPRLDCPRLAEQRRLREEMRRERQELHAAAELLRATPCVVRTKFESQPLKVLVIRLLREVCSANTPRLARVGAFVWMRAWNRDESKTLQPKAVHLC